MEQSIPTTRPVSSTHTGRGSISRRQVAVALVIGGFVWLAWMGRYQVTPIPGTSHALILDRWTGAFYMSLPTRDRASTRVPLVQANVDAPHGNDTPTHIASEMSIAARPSLLERWHGQQTSARERRGDGVLRRAHRGD